MVDFTYIVVIYKVVMSQILENCDGFEWDDGNRNKNWYRHNVTDGECEEIFFNLPLIVYFDESSKTVEQRLNAFGKTDVGRQLFVAFTIRDKLIRVISVRDMTRSEGRIYAEKVKRDSNI